MRRVPSTFALAGWLGFVLVSLLLPGGLGPHGSGTAAAQAAPVAAGAVLPFGEAFAAAVLTIVLLAATTLLAAAIYRLHVPASGRGSGPVGEALGALGLLAVGISAALAPLASLDPFLANEASSAFWAVLLLSVAALWFDRCVAVDDVADDEAEFTAAIAAIAEGMARQTRTYSEPPSRRVDRIG